jgi:hypothetical protein
VRPGSRTKVSVPLVLYRIVILRSCDFIHLSREVIEFKQICHPACPGLPWNRSEAKWRDLLFLFCPSNLTVPNKNHHPPLVIPSVPGFPTSRLYQRQRMRLSLKRAA